MGRKRRQRSKPLFRRTTEKIPDTEQSCNVSTTQESIGQKSNYFTITDIRSLSEQNCDSYDLISVKQDQDRDVPSSAYSEKHDNFFVNQCELPFISEWNSNNSVNVSDQAYAILYNCIPANLTDSVNINQAPSIMNNDCASDYFTKIVEKSVAVKHENIANDSTYAIINEETNSSTTAKLPVVAPNDISNSLQSNHIAEQQKRIDTVPTNDELILFETSLTKHLRQMPLRHALMLQCEIQDIITLERLKCMEIQETK